MPRQNISSGSQYEATYGYSRAVRVGPVVAVAGTTALGPDGAIVGKGDAYAQTKRICEIIERALGEAGAKLSDVVRSRIFLTRLDDAAPVLKAHGEVFGDIRPASTLVAITALINSDMLVEIEVDAVVEG